MKISQEPDKQFTNEPVDWFNATNFWIICLSDGGARIGRVSNFLGRYWESWRMDDSQLGTHGTKGEAIASVLSHYREMIDQ